MHRVRAQRLHFRVGLERRYSNSMWQAGYKLLGDGRWFFGCMDDASRLVTGFGLAGEPSGGHALGVIARAVSERGRPASVLTGRVRPFYGAAPTEFEKGLAALGVRHLLPSPGLTVGKLARFYGQMQRNLPGFEEASARGPGHVGGPFCTDGPRDPVERLVEWHNDALHMSLGGGQTPEQAFRSRAAPRD